MGSGRASTQQDLPCHVTEGETKVEGQLPKAARGGSMTAALIVDVHSHAMPMPLLEWLAERGLAEVYAERDIVRLAPQVSGVGPGADLPLAVSQYDPQTRLEEMDGAGVTHHAVSMPPFLFCSTSSDSDFVRQIIRRGNQELAAYVADSSDRLVALGSVPLGWPGAADEVEYCLDEQGMAGIAIGSRGGGVDLDADVNEELWTVLAEREVFTFLHPSGVPDPQRQRDFWLPQLVGYPMETALAASRLIFGGVLERHDLVLCLAHGGGCLPALRGRLDLGWDRKEVAHTTAVLPSELMNRFYVDTAVFSDRLLERLVEDFGASHVLLGTDHPFELGDRDPVGTVRRLGLGQPHEQAVLGTNAAALLRLDAPVRPAPS
jgi:aminocarboxymuconate-semialdehyde decarboxylase